MYYVLAIDPGVRNIGLCLSDQNENILEWFTESLVPDSIKDVRKLPLNVLSKYTHKWYKKRCKIFEKAHTILIEHQMKDRYILLEGILLGLAGKKGKVLMPAVYKRKLGLCRGSWALNKKAVVRWCKEEASGGFPSGLKKSQKLDDLADTRAMVHYWIHYELGQKEETKRKRKRKGK